MVHLTDRVVTLLYKVVAGVDGGGVARWVVGVLIIKMVVIVRMVVVVMLMRPRLNQKNWEDVTHGRYL